MPAQTEIRYEAGRIARLVFNRPDVLNAITPTLMREAKDAVEEAGRDAGVRVLVVSGAGRGFCAGADLKAGATGEGADPFDTFERVHEAYAPLIKALRALPKVAVAAVRGPAVGAGLSIALACDLVVASRSARFGAVFAKVGLCPDLGAFFFLSRAIGASRARELMLFGDTLDADAAHALGFVHQVHDDDRFDAELAAYTERLASGAPRAQAVVKRMLDRALQMDLAGALHEESLAQSLLRLTEDHKEGLAAFREKRAPRFTGK